MLLAKLFYLLLVGDAEVLPNDLLSNVSANVLAVVAGFFGLGFLLFGLEDLGKGGFVVGGGSEGEDEGALAVGGGADEVVENGVVGFLSGQPVRSH